MLTERGVDVRSGEPLQEQGAFIRIRADEGFKIALRQQHRAAELFRRQTDDGTDRRQRFGAGAAHPIAGVEPFEGVIVVLQPSIGAPTCSLDRPAGAVGCAARHGEIHFGMAFARAVAQDRARITQAQTMFLALSDPPACRCRLEARNLIEQGKAYGIEQS